MSRKSLVLAILLFGAVLVGSSDAATIINRDDDDYKVFVRHKAEDKAFELKAEGRLDGICMTGCVIRVKKLDDDDDEEDEDKESIKKRKDGKKGDEYELDGSETVSVEDGFVFFEGTARRQGAAKKAGAGTASPITPSPPLPQKAPAPPTKK